MITNTREWKNLTWEEFKTRRRRVFADGVELKEVWYVDTDSGIVKTYDVIGDGKAHSVYEKLAVGPDVEILDGEIYSRTIQAKEIELRPFEEEAGS